MKKLSMVLLSIVLAICLSGTFAIVISAASPPEPTYGTANVDGSYGEWDLTNDFFANMYRAADPEKKIESKLYLRYDCANGILYALVLGVEGVPVLVEPDNAFIKLGNTTTLVNGNSGDDGTPPDFAWINSDSQYADGWEASCDLDAGTYNDLNVHTNVYDDEESQTSAVEDRAIDLVIDCEEPATKTGFKFNDLNKNGSWDPGEPGLSGWEIRAYSDNDTANGILDQNEYDALPVDSATTDTDGSYTLTLDPGDYIVVEVLQIGWTQSYPANDVVGLVTTGGETLGDYGYAITLASGDTDEGNNFGNYEEGSTQPPSTPPEVGGEVYPANPLAGAAPLIGLTLVLVAVAIVLFRRRTA